MIDPRPIKTTDFNLNNNKKELLILAGRLGALKFIEKNHKDISISKLKITQLSDKIAEIRKKL